MLHYIRSKAAASAYTRIPVVPSENTFHDRIYHLV